MRKAESLARLARIAELERTAWTTTRGVVLVPPEVEQAQKHGSAAVRAIRDSSPCLGVTYGWDAYAVSEARLAVRAAMRAVGISGAL